MRQRRLLTWLLPFVLIAIGSACGGGDKPSGPGEETEVPGTIRGTVKTQQAEPVSGARVAVEGPTATEDALTGPEGRFEFQNLAPGDYTVQLTVPSGYRPGPTSRKTVSLPGGGTEQVDFRVEAIRSAVETVDAGETDTVTTSDGTQVQVSAGDQAGSVTVTLEQIDQPSENGKSPARLEVDPSGSSAVRKQTQYENQISSADADNTVAVQLRSPYPDRSNGSPYFKVQAEDDERRLPDVPLYGGATQATYKDPSTGATRSYAVSERRAVVPAGSSLNITFRLSFSDETCPDTPYRRLRGRPDSKDRGERIPVVLIHGWQPDKSHCKHYDPEDWAPYSQTFKALVQWLRGNGQPLGDDDRKRNGEAARTIRDNFKFYTYAYPTNARISANADFLAGRVETQAEERGWDNVILLGHSMGGLVARRVLEQTHEGLIHRVLTLGSPHLGTTAANWAVAFLKDLEARILLKCAQVPNSQKPVCFALLAALESGWLPWPLTPGLRDLQIGSDAIEGLGKSRSARMNTIAGQLDVGQWADDWLELPGDIVSEAPAKALAPLILGSVLLEKAEKGLGDGVVPIGSALPEFASTRILLDGHNHLELLSGNDEGDRTRFARNVSAALLSSIGDLKINVTTEGEDVDPDGYNLTLTGPVTRTISVKTNQTHRLEGIPVGEYELAVSDVAENCTVESGKTQTAKVSGNEVVEVSLQVNCNSPTGSLEVSTTTEGQDQDPDGYTVNVEGPETEEKSIDKDGSVTFSDLETGEYDVTLEDVADNCGTKDGESRSVDVQADETTSVNFEIECSEKTGTLKISVSTTGEDQDPNGYDIVIDGPIDKNIAVDKNDEVALDAPIGEYEVLLGEVADNCDPVDGKLRTVEVDTNQETSVSYDVECTGKTGSLKVSTSTSGDDPDSDGYKVNIDGPESREESIGTDGSVTFSDLPTGEYDVTLSDLADNCSTENGKSRTVDVEAGEETSVSYDVECPAVLGILEVTTSTTGEDIPDGYILVVEGPVSGSTTIGANETISAEVPAGDYAVELRPPNEEVAERCDLEGDNPKNVSVKAGETTSVTFEVTCEEASPASGRKDSFEDGEYDDLWTVTRHDATVGVEVDGEHTSDGDLALHVQNSGGHFSMHHEFSEPLESSTAFSFWVYVANSENTIHYSVKNPNGGNATVHIGPWRDIRYDTDQTDQGDDVNVLVAEYDSSKWFKITITPHPDTDGVDFKVEDRAGNEWTASGVPATVDFTRVRLSSTDFNSGYEFWADEVTYKP